MAGISDPIIKSMVSTSPGGLLQMLKKPGNVVVLMPTEINQTSRRGDVLLKIEDLDYFIHCEFQATSDSEMDFRIHDYNFGYGRDYYPSRVESVLILLTPKADNKNVKGSSVVGNCYHSYDIIRVWEHTVEDGLNLPLSLLPFAPLFGKGTKDLPRIIKRMKERIDKEATPEESEELWANTLFLLGLKVSKETAKSLLKGITGMEESSTYMEVHNDGIEIGVRKGREEGRQEGRQEGILLMMRSLRRHFKSEIPENIETQIRSLSMDDLSVLAEAWEDMQSLSELQNWLVANR